MTTGPRCGCWLRLQSEPVASIGGLPGLDPVEKGCVCWGRWRYVEDLSSSARSLHLLLDRHKQLCWPHRTLSQLYGPLAPTADSPDSQPPPLPRFDIWNEARRTSYRRRTVRDTWLCMLCELPGFGVTLAQKVVGAFSTPRSLFDAYEAHMRAAKAGGRDAVAAARGLLKERVGLSVAKSAQVYDDLFANGWHVV